MGLYDSDTKESLRTKHAIELVNGTIIKYALAKRGLIAQFNNTIHYFINEYTPKEFHDEVLFMGVQGIMKCDPIDLVCLTYIHRPIL